MFSGFYLALLLVLVLLIVRVLSFEWREQGHEPALAGDLDLGEHDRERRRPLIWGVALSNLLYGVPIDSDGHFAGSFWDLFSPYTVLAGIAVVLLFAFHGATFLTLRTTGDLLERARHASRRPRAPGGARRAAASSSGRSRSRSTETTRTSSRRCSRSRGRRARPCRSPSSASGSPSGWAFACHGAGAVLVVATLFTSLYPRVMVSQPEFGNSLTVEQRLLRRTTRSR